MNNIFRERKTITHQDTSVISVNNIPYWDMFDYFGEEHNETKNTLGITTYVSWGFKFFTGDNIIFKFDAYSEYHMSHPKIKECKNLHIYGPQNLTTKIVGPILKVVLGKKTSSEEKYDIISAIFERFNNE